MTIYLGTTKVSGGGGGTGSETVVEDNLTSTSTVNALSANQGRILKGEVDGKANATHTHLWADITDKPTEFTPVAGTATTRGGFRVGNGLTYSGDLLNVKAGAGLKIDTLGDYSVDVDRTQTDAWYARNATGQSNIIWKGTQAEYDALGVYDDNTLYFIV